MKVRTRSDYTAVLPGGEACRCLVCPKIYLKSATIQDFYDGAHISLGIGDSQRFSFSSAHSFVFGTC